MVIPIDSIKSKSLDLKLRQRGPHLKLKWRDNRLQQTVLRKLQRFDYRTCRLNKLEKPREPNKLYKIRKSDNLSKCQDHPQLPVPKLLIAHLLVKT